MFFRKKKYKSEIEPDEVFLDSRNLPDFDVHQFEGRIERSISKRSIFFIGTLFVLVGILFFGQLTSLQIVQGEHYTNLAANNHLKHTLIFPERGVVFDRNRTELVWNIPSDEDFREREYIKDSGFAHVLGYVTYPQKDSSGFYFQESIEGKDGVEKYYQKLLSGTEGVKIQEADVFGNILSESVLWKPEEGKNITLSVDARIQNKMYEEIGSLARDVGFVGGAGVIMDISTGELIASVSYPEYDPNVLSSGEEAEKIEQFVKSNNKPFLNRVVAGLYTPGSTVKPFLALAALRENIITPAKEILSTGSIEVQNPYFPDLTTIFNDWKAHGLVDMRKALAVSSNVYFFEIGGGYEEQEGLGIDRIEQYSRRFGLGELTHVDMPGEIEGVIPNPEWKAKNFEDGQWRIGDTYNTSIGQYGFQITPIQLVRGTSAIANNGNIIKPQLVTHIDGEKVGAHNPIVYTIDIQPEHFAVVREGMRQAVTNGTAQGLLMSDVAVAAKTGTAEVGIQKKSVHSWVTGFFPYNNPRYAFSVVMEKGPEKNLVGALYVMRQVLSWMAQETPEYLKQQ